MAEGYAWVLSSSRAELALQRQLPDTLAGCCEDGIGQRGCGDGRRRFPEPARRFQVPHQINFDLRRLVDAQDANVMKVRLLHPAVLERHLAVQGAADSEDDSTLGLRFHRVRVHDSAAV